MTIRMTYPESLVHFCQCANQQSRWRIGFLLLLLYAMVQPLQAAERYWVGQEGSYWDWPTNWSYRAGGPGGYSVPAGGDVAIFGSGQGDCLINVHVELDGLIINSNYGGRVNLAHGMTIKVTDVGYHQSGGTFSGRDGYVFVHGPFEVVDGVFDAYALTDVLTGDIPSISMGFEMPFEPHAEATYRDPDPNGSGNGCMSSARWNLYYTRDICISPTCPVSDYAMEKSTAHARKGSHSLRFMLQPTPPSKWPNNGEASHRVELSPTYNSPAPHYPEEGDTVWYGISYLFPSDFIFAPQAIEDEIRFSIGQWQHGSSGASIIAFEVIGENLVLQRQTGNSTDPQWQEPHVLTSIPPGQWIDLVVQVVWSKTNGKVKIWKGSQVVLDLPQVQTIYHNLDVGGGLKLGLYYWRWKNLTAVQETLGAGITDREFFIDEFRQFQGSDGYSVVKPGQ